MDLIEKNAARTFAVGSLGIARIVPELRSCFQVRDGLHRHLELTLEFRVPVQHVVRDLECILDLLLASCTYVGTVALVILEVPKSGISIVSAGLATGLGFAMQSILENFFYGINLMAGRLHVGDYIVCDGISGKVESIT